MAIASKPRLLSVEETRGLLGGVGRKTLYRWIERGILKPVKIGGRTFFVEQDLLRLIRKSRAR